MAPAQLLSPDYWAKLQIGKKDLEALQTHLLEVETPLTAQDLTPVFIAQRIKAEQQARDDKMKSAGRAYLPRDRYSDGDELVFPLLEWKKGRVVASRARSFPHWRPCDRPRSRSPMP